MISINYVLAYALDLVFIAIITAITMIILNLPGVVFVPIYIINIFTFYNCNKCKWKD